MLQQKASALVFKGPQQVERVPQDIPEMGDDGVLVETLYSGISAGTEMTLYRGTNPFITHTWTLADRRFRVRGNEHPFYPVVGGFGYEQVGRVVAVGPKAEGVKPGEIVYGAWGHRSHVVRTCQAASSRILPEGLPPLAGIFAQIGAIGLNAVLDARINILETVVIFGQGVPGLVATALASLQGAVVVVVEPNDRRREAALAFGAKVAIDPGSLDPAEEIHRMTGGKGADTAIEFSGAYLALQSAIRCVGYNGRVIAAGFYQNGGTPLRLGEEFHHNRVSVVCSQIFGTDPQLAGRWDRLRMEHTIMRLQLAGSLRLPDLVTRIVPLGRFQDAFDALELPQGNDIQIAIDFQAD